MADGDPIRPSDTSQLTNKPLGSFIDHVMTPGSAIVSPTFLLMVDVTLLSLLFLFLSLLVLTWSPHFVALGVITLGLWGSVKLCVVLVIFFCCHTRSSVSHSYPPCQKVCRGIKEAQRIAGPRRTNCSVIRLSCKR